MLPFTRLSILDAGNGNDGFRRPPAASMARMMELVKGNEITLIGRDHLDNDFHKQKCGDREESVQSEVKYPIHWVVLSLLCMHVQSEHGPVGIDEVLQQY